MLKMMSTNIDFKPGFNPECPFKAGDTVEVIGESAWKGTVGVIQVIWPELETCAVMIESNGSRVPVGFGWSELKLVVKKNKTMTKKAQAIDAFVDTLSLFCLNGTGLTMALKTTSFSTMTAEDAKAEIEAYKRTLKAHMVTITEGNEEQAEALMNDLKITWKANPYK